MGFVHLIIIHKIKMITLTLLCVAVTTVLANVPESRPVVPLLDGKIVGGQNVSIENYPYQLSLQYYNQHFCGASLLSSRYAVTAAHCTGLPVQSFRIRAGSSIRGVGGINVTVSNFTRHPLYNGQTIDYDMAILTLGTSIPLGPGIKPVKLPTLNQSIPEGALATVSGWGALQQSETTLPTQLQAVQIPIINQPSCRSYYASGLVTPRMICAGYPAGGKDACQGDSGGPLVLNGVLVGVVSWGNGCAKPNYPGVYTNVAVLRQFISNVTGL